MRRLLRTRRLFLVVAAATATLQPFFQPVNPFVLPGPRGELFKPTESSPENVGFNDNVDSSDCESGSGDHSIFRKRFGGGTFDDGAVVFQPSSRRRDILATIALAMWGFPGIALATSSGTTPSNKNQQQQATSKDRPIDLELSEAVQKLFDLDEPNRLVPGKDYVVDIKSRKVAADGTETTHDPLFRSFDSAIFENRPTYKSFVALLDNYQPNVCSVEDNTSDETREAYTFLKACMATPVLKFCYSYCKSKLEEASEISEGSAKEPPKRPFDTEEDFVELLYKIWFQLYSRSKGCGNENIDSETGRDAIEVASVVENSSEKRRAGPKVYGSSGFEHVFVGEIRNDKVIGFHNWIQLCLQEKAGNCKLKYRGKTPKAGSLDPYKKRVLTYNLQWKGAEKPFGTSLLGVSPVFELALYTMVFLVGKKDNILLLDLGDGESDAAAPSEKGDNDRTKTKLDVKCFKSRGRVGSCYVELLSQ